MHSLLAGKSKEDERKIIKILCWVDVGLVFTPLLQLDFNIHGRVTPNGNIIMVQPIGLQFTDIGLVKLLIFPFCCHIWRGTTNPCWKHVAASKRKTRRYAKNSQKYYSSILVLEESRLRGGAKHFAWWLSQMSVSLCWQNLFWLVLVNATTAEESLSIKSRVVSLLLVSRTSLLYGPKQKVTLTLTFIKRIATKKSDLMV